VPRVTPSELAAWWAELPAAAGDLIVLAVEGRSGSGKTTLAAGLAGLVPAAGTVAMDELYPGWDGLAASVSLLVEHVLRPLAEGRDAAVPRWDWAEDRPGVPRPLARPAGGLLLVEGIGCGARACAPFLAGSVWLDAPTGLRRRRVLARDGDGDAAAYWDRWAAQEADFLRAERPDERADLALDGSAATAGGLFVLVDRRHRRPQ
jgi:uridine kinase